MVEIILPYSPNELVYCIPYFPRKVKTGKVRSLVFSEGKVIKVEVVHSTGLEYFDIDNVFVTKAEAEMKLKVEKLQLLKDEYHWIESNIKDIHSQLEKMYKLLKEIC